ncbi:cell wall hydrolase [Oryzicola mucosus]|uniref:Cell wall hydrolase n=1 Tax=Oryzicola mucosus TaxID=2767425 RepID=A0A8J6U0W0_9HYPH|nr:cell wall hydrolase [Oryzicola mucosus]
MHRRFVKRRFAVAADVKRSFVAPLVIGLGIWIGFPTVAAYQDMTSLISGLEGKGDRWHAYVERSAAGSVHQAQMQFRDGDLPTGSISGAGVELPGLGTVAFTGKKGEASAIPDEARIARSDKKGRIVHITRVAPPKNFTAGSIFQRTSMLRPTLDGELKMTFAEPEIRGKEVEVASTFYINEAPSAASGVPTMLADLVTNTTPDILATAYGPSSPDYARASPFEALLKEENPNEGRFIPPLSPGDHAWMSKPLPAAVFTDPEQQCLATAIYFEARGELLKGQAAVAQVVLNRVRNPTYPDTICGVVYQNDGWRNRCQFSFACDGIRDIITEPSRFKVAKDIALAVTAGKIFIPEVASATHYHATYVNPRWSRTMKKMNQIGLHIFYRTYGGGWS